jgi:hypothetical protein
MSSDTKSSPDSVPRPFLLPCIAAFVASFAVWCYCRYVPAMYLKDNAAVYVIWPPSLGLQLIQLIWQIHNYLAGALAILAIVALFMRSRRTAIVTAISGTVLIIFFYVTLLKVLKDIDRQVSAYDLKQVDDYLGALDEIANGKQMETRELEALQYNAERNLCFALIKREPKAVARFVFQSVIRPGELVQPTFSANQFQKMLGVKFTEMHNPKTVSDLPAYNAADVFAVWEANKSKYPSFQLLDDWYKRDQTVKFVIPSFAKSRAPGRQARQPETVKLSNALLEKRVIATVDASYYRHDSRLVITCALQDALINDIELGGAWLAKPTDNSGFPGFLFGNVFKKRQPDAWSKTNSIELEMFAPLRTPLKKAFAFKNEFMLEPIESGPLESLLRQPCDAGDSEAFQLAVWMVSVNPALEAVRTDLYAVKDFVADGVLGTDPHGWYLNDVKVLDRAFELLRAVNLTPSDYRFYQDAEQELKAACADEKSQMRALITLRFYHTRPEAREAMVKYFQKFQDPRSKSDRSEIVSTLNNFVLFTESQPVHRRQASVKNCQNALDSLEKMLSVETDAEVAAKLKNCIGMYTVFIQKYTLK